MLWFLTIWAARRARWKVSYLVKDHRFSCLKGLSRRRRSGHRRRSEEGDEWFDRNSSKVILSVGAGASPEHRIRVAALMLSSSILAETAAAIVCSMLIGLLLWGWTSDLF